MQYPVPQFTEVEDKIIGNITLKQFVIILVTAVLIFFAYSISKDYVVTAFAGIILGLPGLTLAFAQFNGRPMYNSISIFIKYVTDPKFMIFRKQVLESTVTVVKDVEIVQAKATGSEEDTRTRLKKIQYQLEQRAKQEEEMLNNN